jgi:hypothetical protein
LRPGGGQALTKATHLADRWHLMKNASQAFVGSSGDIFKF